MVSPGVAAAAAGAGERPRQVRMVVEEAGAFKHSSAEAGAFKYFKHSSAEAGAHVAPSPCSFAGDGLYTWTSGEVRAHIGTWVNRGRGRCMGSTHG